MYQALYRKYRPQTFDDVVGQKSVTQTLRAQLISGKLSHAYLFTGSRGTGKTSCAKILAKAVNCLAPEDGNPCNRCAACRSIDSGSCTDVLEIDAASNNGVDNVRNLRDDAVYSPAEVKKRVYIIDEVHMLSISAFNALLKIIEEPPEHLLFILATTELHKVPATILSRCQRFAFRRLSPEDIAARLNYVAYQEGIELTPEAAALLARLADGALRDGMSLLDQCATGTAETLTPEAVYDCLGLAGARSAAELLTHIAQRRTKDALSLFYALYASGKDVSAMLDELVSLCRDLLILKTAPKAGRGMLTGICTDGELSALLPLFTAEELLRHTGLLQQTANGFNRSANKRIDAELCLMRMCEPMLDADFPSFNARLSKLEHAVAAGRFPSARTPTLPEEPEKEQTAPDEAVSDAVLPDELPYGFWPELVEQLSSTLDRADSCWFSTREDSTVTPVLKNNMLLLCVQSDVALQRINRDEIRQTVETVAGKLLNMPVHVRIVLADREDLANGKFAELLRFQQEHKELGRIKETD